MKTRKIKGFKDFMECLRAGKKVKLDTCVAIGEYFLNDGFICFKDDKGWTTYNDSVTNDDCKYMTVEEPEELKLEVGKLYKTRDGRKAFVTACGDGLFYIVVCGELQSYSVISTGEVGAKSLANYDLVAEWED